jgi:hypothetical protein
MPFVLTSLIKIIFNIFLANLFLMVQLLHIFSKQFYLTLLQAKFTHLNPMKYFIILQIPLRYVLFFKIFHNVYYLQINSLDLTLKKTLEMYLQDFVVITKL